MVLKECEILEDIYFNNDLMFKKGEIELIHEGWYNHKDHKHKFKDINAINKPKVSKKVEKVEKKTEDVKTYYILVLKDYDDDLKKGALIKTKDDFFTNSEDADKYFKLVTKEYYEEFINKKEKLKTYSKGFSFNEDILTNKNLDLIRQDVYDLIYSRNPDKAQATEIIVQFIQQEVVLKTTRNDDKEEIWIYYQGIYIPEGRSYIKDITRAILRNAYTTFYANQVINKIEADTHIKQEDFFNNQNKYPELIPVNNGILNIITRDLKPFTPDIYFFNKLSMDYKPNVDCKKFKTFLNEILDNETNKLCIQELFGYCLYKKEKYKKAFMFDGVGDNGKSILLKILTENFIGIQNFKQISLKAMEKDNYIVSELHNVMINVSSDISSQTIEDTGIIKSLTGGDPLSCNRKFKTTITFVSYAKQIFACNEIPIIKDNSKGFWGRWIRIKFPFQFLDQNEIDCLSLEDRQFVKVAKKDIINDIIDNEELTGILNWALDGFKRLENNKGFSYIDSREETKNQWERDSNNVLAFLQDCCEQDYNGAIIKNEFREKYIQYCIKNKHKKICSDKVIVPTITDFGGYSSRIMIYNPKNPNLNEKTQEYVWCGIKFKKDVATLAKVAMEFLPKEKKHIFPLESEKGSKHSNGSKLENNNIKENSKGFSSNIFLDPLSEQEIKDFIEASNYNNEKGACLIYDIYKKFNLYEKQKINDKLDKMCEDGDLINAHKEIYRCL